MPLSNMLVRGMLASVGARGEVIPVSLNTDFPVLVLVVSYDQQTSILTGKHAWVPNSDVLITTTVKISKSNGEVPAGDFCKLQPGDYCYVLRKRKDGAPLGTVDPRDFEWYCQISGNGIICEVPIYVTRVFITPDCTQGLYDSNLTNNIPNPPFDPDHPPEDYCIMTPWAICWQEYNYETFTVDKFCQKWPVLHVNYANIPDQNGIIRKYGFLEYVTQTGNKSFTYRPYDTP